jgi:Restriction endonuclease
MRRFDNFSPYDFEIFMADLLGADLGVRFETFARGPDRGIDLRYVPTDASSGPHVVQCKHYVRSSFSSLLGAAKREAKQLANLAPQPSVYQFVTSSALTAANKTSLATALAPWIKSEQNILGANDIETILDQHPEVERRQVKLWLTGGTQLAALLAAGTIQRSQALLDEIRHAMPRYVQSRVFSEARDRLREQRVLVIAGIPGIGKTTLARMLLADAVLDGYEPIEVSSDIEEGWTTLDASVKQVFLYDDFLGRTALSERFSKNEDRRLIDFMRRATRSTSSLFILTTREYILKQATELYERLGQEGLDSDRFLLELPDYTSLDRARIFANHVFHSPRLSKPFRRALLVEKGYERIIYHANYNPRTIEMITGLAKRWDETVTPDNYVEYAVRTLQHPTLIWKSAFERELDDHGRALILALVSLPRNVSLEHLESAFVALCRERNLSLDNRAFERTLSALDDSLIQTLHDRDGFPVSGGVVVGPYDPSVIDFMVDFLRHSPEDILELARASTFFEQASWLWALIKKTNTPTSKEVLGAILDSLRRTYAASAISPVTVPVGPNTWTYRPFGTRDLEQRLFDLQDIAHADEEFGQWWRYELRQRLPSWEQGQGEPESLLKLLRYLTEDDGVDITVAASAAKSVLASGTSSYMLTLEWLHELWSWCPEAFETNEWDDRVAEFDSWLRDDLGRNAEDMSDPDELELVERIAELYELDINDDTWAEAEDTVNKNKAERDAQIDADPSYERPSSGRDIANERQEIERIFVGLAE